MTGSKWSSGTVLAQRYRLEELLDCGGMGEVWRAEHLQLRSPVAVKLARTSELRDPAAIARLQREAEAGAALRGANVVQILDHGTADGDAFLVMELLTGESLRARLDEVGELTPSQVADVFDQVGRAVARAHRMGLVHRDLKPANIFLARDDEEGPEVVKVLDFGAVKLTGAQLSTALETQTGAVIGTPYYMSPEQLRSSKHVDHRTDLWSLGVVAFQCLTGERPFKASSFADLIMKISVDPLPVPSNVASVPPDFDAWFARAADRDPDKRFQSATELSAELRAALGLRPG